MTQFFRMLTTLVVLNLTSCDYGGIRSNYPVRDNDPVLKEHAAIVASLIDAIEQFKDRTGRIPISVDEINADNALDSRISYSRSSDTDYLLIVRLGWDPSLIYSSVDGGWKFDPGDGRPKRAVKFDFLERQK